MKQNIIIIASILLVILIGFITFRNTALAPSNGDSQSDVLIQNEFDGKVVYETVPDTDSAARVEAFRRDCSERGGIFDDCGSVCEPGAEVCASVCAYTCQLE